MRLPSLGEVVNAAQQSAQRFPFVIGTGAVSAYAAIALVERDGTDPAFTRLLAAAALGLPLLFGLTVLGERGASRHQRWTLPAAGLLPLAGVWLLWPTWTMPAQGIRFALLAVTFHLFVAFAPFIGRREPMAFWQYNRTLLERFLVVAVYTGVLWLGIAGVLLALDKLFGVDVQGEGYARLWMLLSFVFNPWFFVAGVPADIGALEHHSEYPRDVRVFTQYALVPIVAVYLVILTSYLAKVVFTQQWPSGWIGYLVSAVAGVGTFSWLLVHPLEEQAEQAWVKTFTRGFYVAMTPAIVMLWLAIWKRVDQYGVTEPRYIMIALSIWFAAIAVFYAVSGSRNIKVIPASLCAVGVFTLVGPWSALPVSRWSQTHRLQTVLARSGMLDNGMVRKAPGPVADSAAREISAGLRYLLEVHGVESVRPMLTDSVARKVGAVRSGTAGNADAGARAIASAIGVPYTSRWEEGASPRTYNYHAAQRTGVVRIEGYAYALHLDGGSVRDSVAIVPGAYVRVVEEPPALIVTRNGARLLEVPLQPMVDSVEMFRRRRQSLQVPQIPPQMMTVEARSGGAALLMQFSQVTGTTVPKPRITSVAGTLFVRLP